MKKRGFATSAILYTMLLLFLILMVGILNNLQNKKTILDQLKIETIQAIESNSNACYGLQEQIQKLQTELENGKTLIAQALNNRGMETSNMDSFDTMANHINSFNPEYTIGTFQKVKESTGAIAYNGTQSRTVEATYTPTKDCMYMCYAHSTMAEQYMSDVTSNMPGTRIMQTAGFFINIGMAKAGEPITCDYYAKTTLSSGTLYVEIHTNE